MTLVSETVASEASASLPYRHGVGIMLFSRRGEVWVGRRQPRWAIGRYEPFWQMPQGGIEPGERAEVAALRELREETGVSTATIIGRMPSLVTYDLPDAVIGIAMKGRYRGQRQRWFAMQLLGDESEIDIAGAVGSQAEFDAWRWVGIDEVSDLVIDFKRPVYRGVVGQFRHLVP